MLFYSTKNSINMKMRIIYIFHFLLIQLIGFSQCLVSENEFKSYFTENISKLNPIEGIYSVTYTYSKYSHGELMGRDENPNYSNCAIIRDGQDFILCFLPPKSTVINYSKFSTTSIDGIYIWKNSNSTFGVIDGANAKLIDSKLLEFSYKGSREEMIQHFNYAAEQMQVHKPSKSEQNELCRRTELLHDYKLIKLFPSSTENKEVKKNEITSGTGFSISSKPYIVTNYHVIEGSKVIKVRGINNDYNITYQADVVLVDKNNDLAIIKISDEKIRLDTIPFTISNSLSDVGESVFVLGYPLRATMGDELKLTNGIISSRTGFQMDISCYQISAPVQPGNSGGPVFSSNGILIGIINAKHIGAENVSYAIKTTYLLNLIDLLSEKIITPNTNQLIGKTLSEQVKIIRNFVFVIECYND